jgi:hypothetical protein
MTRDGNRRVPAGADIEDGDEDGDEDDRDDGDDVEALSRGAGSKAVLGLERGGPPPPASSTPEPFSLALVWLASFASSRNVLALLSFSGAELASVLGTGTNGG